MFLRWQNNQNIEHNNARLDCFPSEDKRQYIIQFNNLNNYYSQQFVKLLIKLEIKKRTSLNKIHLIYVKKQQQLINIKNKIIQNQYVLLDTYSQYKNCYKGYIKYFILAIQNYIYIINCQKFNNNNVIFIFKDVLENVKIIKFIHQLNIKLQQFKRDWGIFAVNNQAENYLKLKYKYYMISQKISHSEQQIQQNNSIVHAMIGTVEQSLKILHNLIFYLNRVDPQNYYYINSNKYQTLLIPYLHLIPSQQYLNKYYYYQKKNQQLINKELLQCLLQWRQHQSRFFNLHPQQLIPYKLLMKIVSNKEIKSILQIIKLSQEYIQQLQIQNNNNNNKNIIINNYQLLYLQNYISIQYYYQHGRIEIYKQILQIIEIYKINKQNKQIQLFIQNNNILYNNKIKSIQKYQNYLWLERKNDPSILLYKQIISIDYIDINLFQKTLKNINDHSRLNQLQYYIQYAQPLKDQCFEILQQQYNKFKSQHTENILENSQKGSDEKIYYHSSTIDTFRLGSYSSSTRTSLHSFGSQGDLRNEQQHEASIDHYLMNQNSKQIQCIPSSLQDIYRFAAQKTLKNPKKKIYTKPSKNKYQPYIPTEDCLMQIINQ